jgi:hypothetical protein
MLMLNARGKEKAKLRDRGHDFLVSDHPEGRHDLK